MKVPFIDLVAQYNSIKEEIDDAIRRVLEGGKFILGSEVSAFEEELSKYCGVEYAVGVGSGTDALLLSLMAFGIGRGDEVITTPFTFSATAEVISLLGARPVFVDIDPKTYNIDPTKIEEAITPRTRAIIPVHLYGQPADMDEIMEIARRYDLRVIEDCAQAIGAEYRGRRVGTIGDIGCFSFFPAKNLGAYGDGGACVMKEEGLLAKISSLRVHGAKGKYIHEMIGINSRLDTIQAAILRVKLRHLDGWIARRRKIAALYGRSIQGALLPEEAQGTRHVYNQYTIRVKGQERIEEGLKERGVAVAIHYPRPLHLQRAFSYLGYKEGDFPESELASREVISLPIYPELSDERAGLVVNALKEVI